VTVIHSVTLLSSSRWLFNYVSGTGHSDPCDVVTLFRI